MQKALTQMNIQLANVVSDLSGWTGQRIVRAMLAARGATVLRRKMNRLQLAERAATAPRCVIAMESCPGSQYWARAFTKAGHEVRLLPAQFVKPYLKANKNDFNDAEAIAEAGGRASMRCVPAENQ